MPTDFPPLAAPPPVFLNLTTTQGAVVADLLLRYAESGRTTHMSVTKAGPPYSVYLSVPGDEPPELPVTEAGPS